MSLMQMLLAAGGGPPAHVQTFTGTTSVTLSGVLAGDVLIGFASSNDGTTPALPAGFTSHFGAVVSSSGGLNYLRICSKVAAGGETSATFNATEFASVSVYRGSALSIGAVATSNGPISATDITIPGLTLQDSDGSSLVWAAAYAKDSSARGSAPSGLTLRYSTTSPGPIAALFDTTIGVASFTSRTQPYTSSTSGAVFGAAIEIKIA